MFNKSIGNDKVTERDVDIRISSRNLISYFNHFLPVNNSLIDYPVKRYDRAFELASDIINENFTARPFLERSPAYQFTKTNRDRLLINLQKQTAIAL